MGKIRIKKGELIKRKQLLEPYIGRWVYCKYFDGNEVSFVYVKHLLRDKGVYTKFDQIILSKDVNECGVYFVTNFGINRVYDMGNNREILEIIPHRYDLELGIGLKKSIQTHGDLMDEMIKKGYLTEEEVIIYNDFEDSPPPAGMPEILMGLSQKSDLVKQEKPRKMA